MCYHKGLLSSVFNGNLQLRDHSKSFNFARATTILAFGFVVLVGAEFSFTELFVEFFRGFNVGVVFQKPLVLLFGVRRARQVEQTEITLDDNVTPLVQEEPALVKTCTTDQVFVTLREKPKIFTVQSRQARLYFEKKTDQ